jgi:hypothetical protein
MKKLLVIACLLSTARRGCSAGLESFRTVYITSMTASGSLGGARASNDTVQYIIGGYREADKEVEHGLAIDSRSPTR